MSPEKQRIAIAEACGWDIDPVEAHGWGSRGQWCVRPNDAKRQLVSRHMELPNYLNDLNAMHEAEKAVLLGNDWSWDFMDELERITDKVPHFATAAQHAEAFLRTIGKWEGSQ